MHKKGGENQEKAINRLKGVSFFSDLRRRRGRVFSLQNLERREKDLETLRRTN